MIVPLKKTEWKTPTNKSVDIIYIYVTEYTHIIRYDSSSTIKLLTSNATQTRATQPSDAHQIAWESCSYHNNIFNNSDKNEIVSFIFKMNLNFYEFVQNPTNKAAMISENQLFVLSPARDSVRSGAWDAHSQNLGIDSTKTKAYIHILCARDAI